MTFEEIERAARRDEKLPDGTSTIDYAAYYAMKRLYDLYWQKRITVEEASERKKRIRSAFERETKVYQNYMEFTKLYQDRVKKSELLRAEINKGISAGKDERELLSLALRCIREMTGDFWMEEVANKYGNKSGGRKQENISIPHVADDADV